MKKQQQNIVKSLKKCELFADFSELEVRKVINHAKILNLSKGETLFSAGSKADGFYVVLDGAIKVYQLSFEGNENIINIFGKNEMLALAASMKGGRFPAFAEPIEKACVIYIPTKPFLEQVCARPKLAMKVISSLSMLIHTFVEKISDLTLKSAGSRLAAYMLRSDTASFELPVRKSTLALQLNMKQETLSRAFAKFKAAGLIDISGKKVSILDRDALISIVEENEKI